MPIPPFLAGRDLTQRASSKCHSRLNLQRAEPLDGRRRRDKDARWLEGLKESSAMSHKIHERQCRETDRQIQRHHRKGGGLAMVAPPLGHTG